jgi:hypothetical protein
MRPSINTKQTMKFPHLLLFAAGVTLLASAQAQQAMPAAADANAPVTPLQYQSVFAHYVPLKEATQSPDKGWIGANRALLGDEAAAPAPGEKPTAGVSPKAPKPEPMPGKHEHKGTHQ